VVAAAACGDTAALLSPGAAPNVARQTTQLAATSISEAKGDTLVVGQSQQLTAKLPPRRGRTVGTAAEWTSSNDAVATVSATGVVRAVAAGRVTITAANNLGSDAAALVVVAPSG
jgi:uncharacterized protein YjdB